MPTDPPSLARLSVRDDPEDPIRTDRAPSQSSPPTKSHSRGWPSSPPRHSFHPQTQPFVFPQPHRTPAHPPVPQHLKSRPSNEFGASNRSQPRPETYPFVTHYTPHDFRGHQPVGHHYNEPGQPRTRTPAPSAGPIYGHPESSFSEEGLSFPTRHHSESERGISRSHTIPGRLQRPTTTISTTVDRFNSTGHLSDDEQTPVARFQPKTAVLPAPEKPELASGSMRSGLSSAAKYSCTYCGKGFNRPSSLKIHLNSHTGEKPFVCPVEGCGRSFSVLSNMRRHARVHIQAPQKELEGSSEEGSDVQRAPSPSGPISTPREGPSSSDHHTLYRTLHSRRDSTTSTSSGSSRRSRASSDDEDDDDGRPEKRTRHTKTTATITS